MMRFLAVGVLAAALLGGCFAETGDDGGQATPSLHAGGEVSLSHPDVTTGPITQAPSTPTPWVTTDDAGAETATSATTTGSATAPTPQGAGISIYGRGNAGHIERDE